MSDIIIFKMNRVSRRLFAWQNNSGHNFMLGQSQNNFERIRWAQKKINWQKVDKQDIKNSGQYYYESTIHSRGLGEQESKAKLVVNDFPDDPLFSLVVNNREYVYDYLPQNWTLNPVPGTKNNK